MIFLIKSTNMAHGSQSKSITNFETFLILLRHLLPSKIIRLIRPAPQNMISLLYSFSFILQYIRLALLMNFSKNSIACFLI
jgi:hypothetical protein